MRFVCITALCLCVQAISAMDATVRRTIPAVRLSVRPVIDGKLDDPCWKEATQTSGFSDEMLGTPVADDTTVWVGYDDHAVYVAFHAHDPRPEAIIARETKRGAEFYNEDRVRLRLNPFNSRRAEDESELNLNPLGAQMADFAGGRANKQEWEGAWEGAARIVEDGWIAEMAVPWACFVRPESGGEPRTLGINFDRYQARTQIKSYWSNLGPQERRELGGEWTGVGLPQTKVADPLSAILYAYGGYDRGRFGLRAGGDVRYRFTPSFTGVYTLNPDFSNIEGAVTSIDFSYAEKLPEERRPFFLEGADYLAPRLYSLRPFASIRLDDVDAGAKFFGRVAPGTDLGVLGTMDTSGRRDMVVALTRQFSPFDSVTLQGVSRTETGINNQVALGLGRFRRGDWTLQGAYTRSWDRTGPGEATDIFINWGSKTWWLGANYEQTSRNMRARNGYVAFLDQKGVNAELGYWSRWRSGRFRSGFFQLAAHSYDHLDGTAFRNGISLDSSLETAGQWSFGAGFSAGMFEGQADRVFSAGVGYPSQNSFSNAGLRVAAGKRGGRNYWAVIPSAVRRFRNRFSIGLSSEIIHSGATEQQHILTLSYDLARDQGIGGRIVRTGHRTNGYLSLRKSGYGGTEYFVIIGDPNGESSTARFVIKVLHPL
ncbi:MAG: carbohydrate binding family 9 domain-containing protein [Chthonomonadales bacterium]|nr:carbohydrate binding family 9 domain-containing protein [Chthonomonadales bacterium]